MTAPLKEREIALSFDRAAELAVAKMAYSDKYGARDIRRIIRREVEDKIANILIDEDVRLKAINVSAEDGRIVVTAEKL